MINTRKLKGFNSYHKVTDTYGWDLKYTGYDYTESLMKNSLSNYMFRNERLSTFINNHINRLMVFYLNRVKYLRIFFNYAVDKDYQNIN